ncbi:hypothetical protein V6N13_025112 [Hibiscus sabdariffa]|uniref:Uncharacterized protein n=2 Tax=Hibiscus sabdariffa TaxID=183260 RepID=A0ABR2NMB1_9ROSI
METATATVNPTDVQVQHVTKKSSDELLRKFADDDNDDKEYLRVMAVKRRKRTGSGRPRRESSGATGHCGSPSNNGLVERKWLLPPAATRRSTLLKQLGMGRSQLRGRDIRNKSVFATIEKTWRKTIEGASRVFMEKHYNRHRRLINDVV